MIERENSGEFMRFSDRWFLNEYFIHGSVEASIARNDYLPISVANYHKLIRRYGVVGSAGRHTSLPEVLHFFREAALAPDTPLEALYKTMPASFKTSMVTLHRIYRNMEQEIVRRRGVALLVSPESDTTKLLVGQEIHGGNRYKHAGDKTIPMGFAKKSIDESKTESIIRIMQQEVSVTNAINGRYASNKNSALVDALHSQSLSPVVTVTILDVTVEAYRLVLSDELLTNLSSYKLSHFSFENAHDVPDLPSLRPGVSEIVNTHLTGSHIAATPLVSYINVALFTPEVEKLIL